MFFQESDCASTQLPAKTSHHQVNVVCDFSEVDVSPLLTLFITLRAFSTKNNDEYDAKIRLNGIEFECYSSENWDDFVKSLKNF